MPSNRIKLTVTDVQLAVPASLGVEAGMVILTEDEAPGRILRIIIGQPEARAIIAAWRGAIPGRPSTWDLLLSSIALLGGRVDAVVITAVEEERHYYAQVELTQGGERRTLACRPSDGIALAVRAYGSEIMAERGVLDDAGVLPDGSRPPPPAAEPADEADGPVFVPGQARALGVPQAKAAASTDAAPEPEEAPAEPASAAAAAAGSEPASAGAAAAESGSAQPHDAGAAAKPRAGAEPDDDPLRQGGQGRAPAEG